MLNDREKRISAVNEARMTTILMGHLKPHLDEMKAFSTSKLKNLHRTGPHDLAQYMSCAAELCAIEDLEVRLGQSVTAGDRASEEMNERNP